MRTNNITGYKLNMSSTGDITSLSRDSSGDGIIASIPTLSSAAGATASSLSDNTWGYRVNNTGNFVPYVSGTQILENHYATNEDNATVSFASKINYDQAAGSYSLGLTFAVTASYAAYDINYYNGYDNTSTIATQSSPYNTSSNITLAPGITPTRNTYDFVKWCDTVPTADSNNYFPATVCSGNSYNTGDTITIDPTVPSTTINLYAYWDPTTFDEAYLAAGKSKSGSYYVMQDMSPSICNAVTINEVTQLTDTRSGNYTYYVAKLKDDKCWMLQNLRLGTNTTSLALTNADSNISASSWTLNNKTSTMPSSTLNPDDRHTSATYYYNGNAYYCAPVSGNSYVGCYYNWYTATAGAGTSSITPVGSSIGYRDVSTSICPKNWYLPSGGGVPLTGSTSDRPDSDFNVLRNNYPSASEMLVPGTTTTDNTSGQPRPGLLLSGGYNSGGAGSVGVYGNYWSRSAYSKGMAYYLGLNSSVVYPQNYGHKNGGEPVRCVAYGS